MRTYHVQLANIETPATFEADDEPEIGTDDNYRQYWQFKRGDEIVAKFRVERVVGWWYIEKTRGRDF